MSVATKSYVSSYANNQHSDEMAQRPRSPASTYTQPQQRISTPYAATEPNLKRPSPSEDDGDHRGKRQKIESGDDRMEIESTVLPTNHERQNNGTMPEDLGGRLNEQMGSQTGSVVQSEAAGVNNSDGSNLGEAFLLCKSPVVRSRPDPDKHLLAMYGLSDLLRSVARTDPHTGDKINKLRKSYEGQIKTFGLPGRNRAEKADRPEDEPGPLRKLASMLDSKWDAEQGKNKIEVTSDFREKLKSAMQIQPGKVRNNAEWEDILGHEKPRPNVQALPSQISRNTNGPVTQSRPTVGQALHAANADKRATRGKKRSYDDESFVGYGEGYSDLDEEGLEDELLRRRRKKNSFGANSR